MSGYSQEAGSLGSADYAVFGLMLAVSSGIGLYYGWVDRRKRSAGEFLTGSRTLTALPVSMSLTAGIMSSTTILSNPAEVRRYDSNQSSVFFKEKDQRLVWSNKLKN